MCRSPYHVKKRRQSYCTEKSLDDLTRPTSPNSLINDSKKGGDAIKNDWEKNKLKKRVDANEEGVNKAHDILDQLAKQIQDIKDDLDETKDKLSMNHTV